MAYGLAIVTGITAFAIAYTNLTGSLSTTINTSSIYGLTIEGIKDLVWNPAINYKYSAVGTSSRNGKITYYFEWSDGIFLTRP